MSSPQVVAVRSWHDRDIEARARAIDLTAASQTAASQLLAAPAAKLRRTIDEEADVSSPQVVAVRSWHDRDIEARARAIDLTAGSQTAASLPSPLTPRVCYEDEDDRKAASDDGDAPVCVARSAWAQRYAAAEAVASVSTGASPLLEATPEPRSSPGAAEREPSQAERTASPVAAKREPSQAERTASPVAAKREPSQAEQKDSPPTQPIPEPQTPLFDPYAGLDKDQCRAVQAALSGRNLFLTGGAGVGKSHTLRRIIGALQQRFGESHVAVTASTGTASVHLEPFGQTLHSMAGVGVPQCHDQFGRIWARGGHKVKDWAATKVLVVDEVSMLDAEFFDWLSVTVGDALHYERGPDAALERRTRWENGEPPPGHGPFGGDVQLILCGDFLQLPPVGPPNDAPGLRDEPSAKQLEVCDVPYRLRQCAGKPAFMSVCWREARMEVVELTTIHRQRDARFVKALNQIRRGVKSSPDITWLREQTRRPLPTCNGVEPVKLFPTNAKCGALNAARLEALPTAQVVTSGHDCVEASPECPQLAQALAEHGRNSDAYEQAVAQLEEELLADEFFADGKSAACRVPGELPLKEHAQVMLLRNEGPAGFVNGDIGLVVGYEALEPGGGLKMTAEAVDGLLHLCLHPPPGPI